VAPLFSVIVPTRGREPVLHEAFRSVLGQTVPDFECLVVDDHSPEPVRVPDDPRVRVIRRSQRGGAAAARNTGLAEARGKYVTFLDDDDLYLPERLALGLEGVRRAPLAMCWIRLEPPPGAYTRYRLSHNENRRFEGYVHGRVLEGGRPHLGQATVPLERAPRFDERFPVQEDVDWYIRTSGHLAATTVPLAGYVFRRHRGERLSDNFGVRLSTNELMLELHAEYFRRYPRAAAERWRHVGMLSARVGDPVRARTAYLRSIRLRPRLSTMVGMVRSLKGRGPSRLVRPGQAPPGEGAPSDSPSKQGP
jgi:glycosyltransferase involved in cell wall biosynthesis